MDGVEEACGVWHAVTQKREAMRKFEKAHLEKELQLDLSVKCESDADEEVLSTNADHKDTKIHERHNHQTLGLRTLRELLENHNSSFSSPCLPAPVFCCFCPWFVFHLMRQVLA